MPAVWTPRGMYDVLRGQLGSIRDIYIAGDRVARKDDFKGKEVVLLLHGFFQTRNIWEVMEDRLRHDGYTVMSFNLGGILWKFNTRPVDTIAEMIAAKIEALAERHGFAGIHIVGHSKGGLIARRYVQHYGGDKRVLSLTTLGTPHHGAPTAVIVLPMMMMSKTSVSDLLPNSQLIRAINRDTFPAHIPLVSVYSRQDLVCPFWASILRPRPGETSIKNVMVRGLGHSELCWDPGVYRIVRQNLEDARALASERLGGGPLAS